MLYFEYTARSSFENPLLVYVLGFLFCDPIRLFNLVDTSVCVRIFSSQSFNKTLFFTFHDLAVNRVQAKAPKQHWKKVL